MIEYFSISILLNIVLTFMIITRLILHTRNTRAAMGMTGLDGLSKAIVTMLIESCALYTASSLLVIGSSIIPNGLLGFFWPIFSQIQVRAFRRRDLRMGCLM